MNEKVNKWTKFDKIWLIFAVTVISLTIIYKNNGLVSSISSLCGVIYVILIAKQNKYGYIFGIVNVFLYGLVTYSQQIYGLAFYNIVYSFPMMIYGFLHWSKSEEKNEEIVKRLSTKVRAIGTIILGVVIIVLALVLKYKFNSSLPLPDSVTTICSYVAVWLMTRKYIEQWIMWMLANLAGIVLNVFVTFSDINNLPILIMWVIYLLNSIYGYVSWKKQASSACRNLEN